MMVRPTQQRFGAAETIRQKTITCVQTTPRSPLSASYRAALLPGEMPSTPALSRNNQASAVHRVFMGLCLHDLLHHA